MKRDDVVKQGRPEGGRDRASSGDPAEQVLVRHVEKLLEPVQVRARQGGEARIRKGAKEGVEFVHAAPAHPEVNSAPAGFKPAEHCGVPAHPDCRILPWV